MPIAEMHSSFTGKAQQAALSAQLKKGQYAKLRTQVMPSSRQFDPYAYLGIVHVHTTMEQLLQGMQHLQDSLGQQTTELRALVRENFERFISCKNTIDDIEKGLQRAEMDQGDATNTKEVLSQLKEV